MITDWDIIHEMDNEDGTPSCYAKMFGDQIWWVTQFPDCWIAEAKVKIFLIIALNQHTPRYGNPSPRRQVWRKADPARSGG